MKNKATASVKDIAKQDGVTERSVYNLIVYPICVIRNSDKPCLLKIRISYIETQVATHNTLCLTPRFHTDELASLEYILGTFKSDNPDLLPDIEVLQAAIETTKDQIYFIGDAFQEDGYAYHGGVLTPEIYSQLTSKRFDGIQACIAQPRGAEIRKVPVETNQRKYL